MADLPELTESDVRRWTGETSFERGERYFSTGHILDPRLQGDTLKARCLGSHPGTYHVEVTLGQQGIVSGNCSCPVGGWRPLQARRCSPPDLGASARGLP